jgi:hypothetical protein
MEAGVELYSPTSYKALVLPLIEMVISPVLPLVGVCTHMLLLEECTQQGSPIKGLGNGIGPPDADQGVKGLITPEMVREANPTIVAHKARSLRGDSILASQSLS